VARRTDRLAAVAERIRARGGPALAIAADITDEARAREAVEHTVHELGRLDILVNNAGVMLLGPVEEARTADWRRMVEVNLLGLLYCAHAALPHLLRAAGDGPRNVADLINVSSVAGRVTRPGSAAYNATKHGVGAFSDALRQEVADRGVRVSLIEPGLVATELVSHNPPEIREASRRRFAGVEPLRPEDIAEAIAFMVTRPRRATVAELMIRTTSRE